MVGTWLHQAEGALRQEIVIHQAHDETANTVHRALEQHKVSMEPYTGEKTRTPNHFKGAGYSGDSISLCSCAVCIYTGQDVLKSLESHQQVFQRIHKDRSVDGVPVPPDQLQDMAER